MGLDKIDNSNEISIFIFGKMKISQNLLSFEVEIDACRVEILHNYSQEAAPWENFHVFLLSADFFFQN